MSVPYVYSGKMLSLLGSVIEWKMKGFPISLALDKKRVGSVLPEDFIDWPRTRHFDIVAHLKGCGKVFNGISIDLDASAFPRSSPDFMLCCVDIDSPRWNLPGGCTLPPTLKEKSPRGLHLIYRLPSDFVPTQGSKIKWRPGIDLLIGTRSDVEHCAQDNYLHRSVYDDVVVDNDQRVKTYSAFENHVLCSPTEGYARVWPEGLQDVSDLSLAPKWLLDEFS